MAWRFVSTNGKTASDAASMTMPAASTLPRATRSSSNPPTTLAGSPAKVIAPSTHLNVLLTPPSGNPWAINSCFWNRVTPARASSSNAPHRVGAQNARVRIASATRTVGGGSSAGAAGPLRAASRPTTASPNRATPSCRHGPRQPSVSTADSSHTAPAMKPNVSSTMNRPIAGPSRRLNHLPTSDRATTDSAPCPSPRTSTRHTPSDRRSVASDMA